MALPCDLILQSYLAELTRLRALAPEAFADELESLSPILAPVSVLSSTS